MECRQVQFHLMAYLDGDLAPVSAQSMESHIDGCRYCRATRDEMTAFDGAVRGALAFPDLPYTYRRLAARLPDIAPLDEVAAFLPQLRVSGRAPRLAMASVMLVMLLLGQISIRQGGQALSSARDMAMGHDQRIKAAFLEYLDTDDGRAERRNRSMTT